MRRSPFLKCAIIAVAIGAVTSGPAKRDASESKFFFESFPKGVMFSRVTANNHPGETATSPSIRYVPLISLLGSFFPNFIAKLGYFTGVNKYVNTRTSPQQPEYSQATVEQVDEDEDEDDEEEDDDDDEDNPTAEKDEQGSELIECDADHLGLWPDKSDSQRYYKCEIDPRTPSTANCIKDMFRAKRFDNPDAVTPERIQAPGVKPCFLLYMMKCDNGFKYHHKTRICVPDIIFATRG